MTLYWQMLSSGLQPRRRMVLCHKVRIAAPSSRPLASRPSRAVASFQRDRMHRASRG